MLLNNSTIAGDHTLPHPTTDQPFPRLLNFSHFKPVLVQAWGASGTGVDKWTPLHWAFILVSLLGVTANGLLCAAFLVHKPLRTPRNIYVLNLAAGNLLMAAFLVPFVYVPQTERYWTRGSLACKFVNSFTGVNVYCTTFSVMAIAADRTVSVCQLKGGGAGGGGGGHTSGLAGRVGVGGMVKRRDMMRSCAVCVLIWLLSCIFVSPLYIYYHALAVTLNVREIERTLNATFFDLPGAPNATTFVVGTICHFGPPPRSGMIAFTITQVTLLLPVPLSFVCAFNYKLHRVLKYRERRMKLHSALVNRFTSLHAQRMEAGHRRITVLLVVMVLAMAVVWVPFHVLTVIDDLFRHAIRDNRSLRRWDVGCQLLGHTSLLINPMLYGFMNKTFWVALRRVVGRGAERCVSLSRQHSGATRTRAMSGAAATSPCLPVPINTVKPATAPAILTPNTKSNGNGGPSVVVAHDSSTKNKENTGKQMNDDDNDCASIGSRLLKRDTCQNAVCEPFLCSEDINLKPCEDFIKGPAKFCSETSAHDELIYGDYWIGSTQSKDLATGRHDSGYTGSINKLRRSKSAQERTNVDTVYAEQSVDEEVILADDSDDETETLL